MARQLAKQGDKKRALLCLQRKRYQEELLAKTDQQLSNLEQMVWDAPEDASRYGTVGELITVRGRPACALRGARQVATIEFAQIEVKVVEGLKLGNEVLKELNNQLRVEDIEHLMAETEDARAQREVRCAHLLYVYGVRWRAAKHDLPGAATAFRLSQEVSAALAAKLTDADEEAINAELEAMLETVRRVWGRLQCVPLGGPQLTRQHVLWAGRCYVGGHRGRGRGSIDALGANGGADARVGRRRGSRSGVRRQVQGPSSCAGIG